MYHREAEANIYLANDNVISNGMPEDRELIFKTGIAVSQVPDGVEWDDGEAATFVVGIAASPNEHLSILRNLTVVVLDEKLAKKSSKTIDKLDIIEALTGELPSVEVDAQPDLQNKFLTVINNPTALMRTEFLFLDRGETPSEEEQYEVYRDMALALGGAPLTIRTLDIGGDKMVSHLNLL